MDLGLKDKAVLVLASSKGLGKATAMKFAEEGANVMITSRDEAALQAAAEEIREKTGSRVEYMVCDITKKEEITGLVSAAAEAFGTIDVLVNNAGGPPAGNFDAFGDDDWEFAFQLTLLSLIRTVREVLPHMRKKGSGRIINIASSSIKQPIDGLTLSNTFRTAINGLSKSLSQELGNEGILINTVGPGRIGTDRLQELDGKIAEQRSISKEQVKEEMVKNIPLGRYGTPEEFAKTIVYLGSEANTYVTGQSFLIDGGMVKAL